MANIITYQTVTPASTDLVLGNYMNADGISETKTFTVASIAASGGGGGSVTSLTTVGTSGAATLNAGVLNIPTPSSSPFTFNASSTTGIESSSNTASGGRSTAMGVNSTASGVYSTAMGSGTTASGSRSTAMGNSTTASGNYSTSMGDATTASGTDSTAMGDNTTASGISSTVMGVSTEAIGYASTAVGQYNVLNSGNTATSFNLTNTAFSIGNGTSAGARSDAFSVLFNGNTTVAGSITSASLNIAALNAAPASASATGTIGEIKFTADHIYVCVATNTWKRVAIATF